MQFEIRKPNVSSFGLFLRIASSVQGVCGAMPILGSISVKNVFGILIGIALNLSMALGIMDNLTISILSINEYGRSFYLLVSFHFFGQCLTVNVHFEDLSSPQLIHS